MKVRIQAILVDMDGVLVDWVRATCLLFERDPEEVYENWDSQHKGLHRQLGITIDEMFSRIDALGTDFWSGLPDFAWTTEMLAWLDDVCDEYGVPWYICSSPSRHPTSLSGKKMWIDRKLQAKRRFILTPQKHLLADEAHLLIDDRESNIKAFVEGGGRGVLFPAPWNRRRAIKDPLKYVTEDVESILQGRPASL